MKTCELCRKCTCSACPHVLTDGELDPYRRTNVRDKNTQVKCTTCKNKRRADAEALVEMKCNACHGLVEITETNPAKRYNLRRSTAWVCPQCEQKGFTHKDVQMLYGRLSD